MTTRIRLVLIGALGVVAVAGATGYAAYVRGGESPATTDEATCPQTPLDFHRLSADEVAQAGEAVAADRLVRALTGGVSLPVSATGKRNDAPGIFVLPKATDMYGIGPTVMVVTVRPPGGVPAGRQRWRPLDASWAKGCPPTTTSVWTQEFDLDLADDGTVDRRFFVAQVALNPVRVVAVWPQAVDGSRRHWVGERTYLKGGPPA